MQCACAILSSVACPALQYFLHYFIKSTIFVQWESSSSMQTDGRADTTKLRVAFLNFANASKNELFFKH